MMGKLRGIGIVIGLALLMCGNLTFVGAQAAPPDMTKFGYATVAKSMDLTPDQAATITMGDQSVAIKAGTFDNPVTFDLLTSDPSQWKDLVKDRTVRAAFAFRITDKTTKALVGALKQPVTYSYSGPGAAATDVDSQHDRRQPASDIGQCNADHFRWQGEPYVRRCGRWLAGCFRLHDCRCRMRPAARAGCRNDRTATGRDGYRWSATVPTTLPKTGEARATGMSPLQMIVPVGGADAGDRRYSAPHAPPYRDSRGPNADEHINQRGVARLKVFSLAAPFAVSGCTWRIP